MKKLKTKTKLIVGGILLTAVIGSTMYIIEFNREMNGIGEIFQAFTLPNIIESILKGK
jgi:hypothetical protein